MKLTVIASNVALSALVFTTLTGVAAELPVPPEKCDSAWSMASPGGEIIEEGGAEPLVFNFLMVDSNEDGTIEKGEFKKACAGGLILADEEIVKDIE